MVFRIRGANWLNTSDEAYEEWYLLDDSAAMDRLNDAAVSGACEEPHNRVAREAADGTGGLYRLREGLENLDQAKIRDLAKQTRRCFLQKLLRRNAITNLAARRRLWGRQMTLGPTTEFCIHSQSPISCRRGIAVIVLA